MEIINNLFDEYLSNQNVASGSEYSALADGALEIEKRLRGKMSEEQTKLFEDLFELTTQNSGLTLFVRSFQHFIANTVRLTTFR